MHPRAPLAPLVALLVALPLGAPAGAAAGGGPGSDGAPDAGAAAIPSDPGAPDSSGTPAAGLEAWPVPELGQTLFFVRFPDPREAAAALVIRDVLGDEVVRLDAPVEDGAALVVWDGRDAGGQPAAAGTFLATLEGAGTLAGGEPPAVQLVRP